MPETKLASHLTAQTPLVTAINSWQAFLADQGRSPNTIKAFLSDVRLLTTFLPEDVAIGKINTKDLNRYLEWMKKSAKYHAVPKLWRAGSLQPNRFSAGYINMVCW